MSMSARELLIDAVLEQIRKDVENGDFTAIHELLFEISTEALTAYLPEDQQ